jgi:endoglucanase
VREILAGEMRAAGLEVSTDGLGSVIGVLRAAHMEEVGGVVKLITPEGMVRFQMLGGWLDQALVDQRWTILTNKGPVAAVSGLRSVHITPAEERTKVTPRDDLFLDVGARAKQDAEARGIRPGDPIVPVSPFAELAAGRYVSKALDDRVGCAMMLEALRRLKEQGQTPPGTIYFVGTVPEEVGLRGARTAVDVVKPQIGISLESGIAADHPGGGPAISLADSSMLVNLKLRDFFMRIAAENKIPLQVEVTAAGGQDAAEMQRYGAGRPSINSPVPTRYLHSHNSVIDRADLDHAVNLLVKILLGLDEKTAAEIARF